ncbi:3'(2'),5'-bisphosphate nucleotidase CysQ [Sulfitobacter sp. PS-8MA]|uniref:3'(2'),5'-bisphosphate nucleotidase CysQ n=1 Tax=Sulfitobacter sp. PS-8MA TaxID=3237707 RepID=UPI0034C602FF
MPGPKDDLDLLIAAARAAGEVARGFAGPSAKSWDKPDNAGPVTEADLAVNDLLLAQLRGARPDYGWLSEETEDNSDRLAHDRVFIIDQIDGTRSFVAGENTWAHSLALAEAGEVTAAVVYLPLRDMLYAASRGGGATLNGTPILSSSLTDLAAATVLAARPALVAERWHGGAPPVFKRSYRPSLAYRMALVADASFDAMITLRRTWEWDIAAGTLIVTEAGGQCSTAKGGPLRFNNPDPRVDGIVAGGPAIQAALIDALA